MRAVLKGWAVQWGGESADSFESLYQSYFSRRNNNLQEDKQLNINQSERKLCPLKVFSSRCTNGSTRGIKKKCKSFFFWSGNVKEALHVKCQSESDKVLFSTQQMLPNTKLKACNLMKAWALSHTRTRTPTHTHSHTHPCSRTHACSLTHTCSRTHALHNQASSQLPHNLSIDFGDETSVFPFFARGY